MSKSTLKEKQNLYRTDAMRFFEWCRSNHNYHLEKLDTVDKAEFETGRISKKVFNVVRSAWSDNLKSHLSWSEHFSVVRKVLSNLKDYDSFMNCSMHLLDKLPKRILTTVADGKKKRAKEIHDSFSIRENYLIW